MGRVTTVQVRHFAEEILSRYRDKFTTNFTKNKRVIEELTLIKSKKIRNKLTGNITHMIKSSSSPKIFETPYRVMENRKQKR